MAIISNNPIVVPVQNYNIWWIEKLTITALNPSGTIDATLLFRRCAIMEGRYVLHPTEEPVEVNLTNIFAEAGALAETLSQAMDTLGQIAKNKGFIS